jgi:multiple sugar transport system permease protein
MSTATQAGSSVDRRGGHRWDRNHVENVVFAVLRRVVIVLAVVITAVPLLYALFLSVRPLSRVVGDPLGFLPTDGLQFDTYAQALRSEENDGYGLARFMGNSLVLATATTVLTVVASTLGAYAAVRLRFRGREAINGFFFAIYVFPGIVLAVPLFVMFSQMGLRGTIPGLIIIYMAQTLPVCVYMLRNYFHAVPPSIEDAAMVDGCGRLQVIRHVVLPVAVPGIAATALYVFMIAWNEFLFALLFLVQDRERWTISLGLAQLTDIGVPVTVLMAGSVALTVPVVVLFFMAERLLVSGLTAGAEKG